MKDSILAEMRRIRRVRAQRSIELGRDVQKAMEESHRIALAHASDVVWIGPYKYRATFRPMCMPGATAKKRK